MRSIFFSILPEQNIPMFALANTCITIDSSWQTGSGRHEDSSSQSEILKNYFTKLSSLIIFNLVATSSISHIGVEVAPQMPTLFTLPNHWGCSSSTVEIK
jgi:hypothetical protein